MRPHLPVTLALAGALVAGCSNRSTFPPGTGTAPAAPTPTATPTTIGPLTVRLHRFPAGLAVVGINTSAKQLSIEIKAAGLAAGTTHPARLMTGSCAHPGSLLHPLDPLVVGANSIADTSTTVSNVAETEIPRSGWSLAVYRGTAAADQATAIMCGDIDNEVAQTVVTAGIGVALPPGGPDPHAAGTVTLHAVGGQLQVVVDVTGLTPGSGHAAQLRRGNCEGEGDVVHPLSGLTADAAGHAVSTTMVPGVAGIPLDRWFVGVSRPDVVDPVLCGNVGV